MSKVAWVVLVVIGLAFVLVFALPMVLPVTSRHLYSYDYGGMMGPWMMGGFGIIGSVLTILFLVLLFAGLVWMLQSMSKSGAQAHPPAPETPLDILSRRYASGEITKKQYQEMKRDLGL